MLIFLGLGFGNLFLVEGKNWLMSSINTDTIATILLFYIAGMCGFGLFVTIKLK
jgi:hypothetical protein